MLKAKREGNMAEMMALAQQMRVPSEETIANNMRMVDDSVEGPIPGINLRSN